MRPDVRARLIRPGSFLLVIVVMCALFAAVALGSGSARGRIGQTLRNGGTRVATKLGWMRGPAIAASAVIAAPVLSAGPVPPTQIGMNQSLPIYYTTRLFANLALGGGGWTVTPAGKPARDMRPDELTPDGYVARLEPGAYATHQLTQPFTIPTGERFHCSWDGTGDVSVSGEVTHVVRGPHLTNFVYNGSAGPKVIFIHLVGVDSGDPFRNFDCREVGMDPKLRFDPAAIERMKGFKIIRFMDPMNANGNPKVSWATRHTPASLDYTGGDGLAIEDIIAFSNEVGADPWITLPWNGDADYQARIARYVHDHLAPGRKVYVELGNEVWNRGFPISNQAKAEGVADHLAPNADDALGLRYAERYGEIMRIWTPVFADNPRRLVRVFGGWQAVPSYGQAALAFKDTPHWVDAYTTAAYFAGNIGELNTHDVDVIFQKLPGLVDQAIASSLQNKATAQKYGKRYIAYEGGQHIIFGADTEIQKKIQRDPRMYEVYRYFFKQWRDKVGDVLVLYNSVGGIGPWGAFGHLEWDGQPMSEAPKMRAAKDELTH